MELPALSKELCWPKKAESVLAEAVRTVRYKLLRASIVHVGSHAGTDAIPHLTMEVALSWLVA